MSPSKYFELGLLPLKIFFMTMVVTVKAIEKTSRSLLKEKPSKQNWTAATNIIPRQHPKNTNVIVSISIMPNRIAAINVI